MFNALVLDKNQAGKVETQLKQVDDSDLPDGDVTVTIDYSTLNYKDGLVLAGLGGLVKHYPHVPGVDFVGTVAGSDSESFKPGDAVILTGWRVGELHWGGYAQKARVKSEWLVPLPDKMTSKRAMAIGTAGVAAMLGVIALEQHGLSPEAGPVLVTGAAGGVGSIACALLSKAGYEVHGSTGRPETADYLTKLGVTEIVAREELAEPNTKPLNKERWAGAIDSVGGPTLSSILTQLRYMGSVAAIGLAGGNKLETTVIPFLLRGINLLGIDSVMCPSAYRLQAWKRLATDLDTNLLDSMTVTIPLSEVAEQGNAILKGAVRGRLVVDVNA